MSESQSDSTTNLPANPTPPASDAPPEKRKKKPEDKTRDSDNSANTREKRPPRSDNRDASQKGSDSDRSHSEDRQPDNVSLEGPSRSNNQDSNRRRSSRGGNDSRDRDDSRRNQNRRGNKSRGGRNRNRRKNNSSGRSDDRGENRPEDGDERKRQHRQKEPVDPGPPVEAIGLVEISPKGFGFLRQENRNYQQSPNDVFITPEVVRIHGLRDGVQVKCMSQLGNRGPQLTELLEINGGPPEVYHNLPYFEELTAINPCKRYALETKPDRYTTRVIDMMTPIGRGQRGLIVAPPRTGKTTILQHIAEAILENYEDEVHLMVLLVDERPEEVTDFKRSLPGAEIMASSNDSNVKDHTRIAQLAIERAKRLVEAGEHVFILLDSITRMARAFNNSTKGKGRGTATGGLSVGALEIPRKLFAAARNTREAGSLTIIATALIETNSRMDDAIFQEFKGTGNMELVLNRGIAQNYIYPAADIHKSGTRREELLLAPHMLEKIQILRRGLAGHKPDEAMQRLLSFLERFSSNAQMLLEIKNP